MIRIFKPSKKYGVQQILIDDEDYELYRDHGCYLWTTPRHHSIYVLGNDLEGKQIRLHRLIMNAPQGLLVDHINGNALDNRRCNLRICTSLGNNANSRKRKHAKTSKYKGVSKSTTCNRWIAQIQFNKKKVFIGNFKTELEAAIAYNNVAANLFGEFALLNKIV